MKNTNKNFVYNIIYQIFIFIIPLISMPYVSRVLGVNNVGIYSFSYSIIYYFMLCSMIGINNFGARKIAKNSNSRMDMSNEFINIYVIQFILSVLMLFMYIFCVIFIFKTNTIIMIIQTLFLISVLFDINWFFFGIEQFKITISRNIIIKILSLLLIFIFVKSDNDLWKYTLIMSVSTLISQIYLWFYFKKYIDIKKPKICKIRTNIKPCLILFIPIIAYSIYRVMDKTMIGFFSNTIQLGNYESAEKIINIPISFITALGTVMLPHMSKIDNAEFNNKIYDTFKLTFTFLLPMCVGMFIVSEDFSKIFFGDEFLLVGNIIKILLPSVLFTGIANVIRTSYLIPKELDKIYVKSTIFGSVLNLCFNLIFIKKYGAYGACVGTVIAELFVMLYQIVCTKKNISYKKVFNCFILITIKSLFMALIIIIIGLFIKNTYFRLLLQILCGLITYFLLNYNYVIYEFLGRGQNEK